MIAIADFVSAGTGNTPLPAISWPLGAPANGDVLLAVCLTSGSGVVIPPAGWIALFNPGAGGSTNYTGAALFWKLAASEPASLFWDTSSGAGVVLDVSMLRVSGAVTTTPQWVQTTSGASPIVAGPLTPVAANALVVAGFTAAAGAAAFSVSAGWTQVTSAPGGWQTFVEQQTALSADTTTPLSVSSTVTGSVFGVNGFLIIVAPAAVIPPVVGGGAIGNGANPGGAVGNSASG